MATYLRFELRRQLRNWTLLVFVVVMPVVIYVLFSDNGDDSLRQVEGARISGEAYVMVALTGFGAVMGVLSIASGVSQERQSGWLRQLRATPLPPSRVLVAKGAVSTVVALPVVGAVGATAELLHGLSLSAGQWVVIVAVTWLGTVPFALLGLAVGYGLPPQQSYAVTMLGWLALAALGGWMTTIQDFPGWLQQVARLTPSYRYSELGWRAVDSALPTAAGAAILGAWVVVFGVLAAWTYRRYAANP